MQHIRTPIFLWATALLAVVGGPAQAAAGLVAPAAETLWPQWRARVSLQAAGSTPLALSRALDGTAALQGGAVLGDYVFATPSFGSFSASGGLLMGALGGMPLSSADAGSRVKLSLNSAVAPPLAPGSGVDNNAALPYVGLGFSGAPWLSGLAVSADLGLVAERSRAVFGSQGADNALRELRLSPVLQLGVRLRF